MLHLRSQTASLVNIYTGMPGRLPLPLLLGPPSGLLENSCASRSYFNNNIVVKLDLFHCMRRFSRECTSEHHPLFSTFCQLLSAPFSVVDQEDLSRFQDAFLIGSVVSIQPIPPNSTYGSTAGPKYHNPQSCWTEWKKY